jgi:ectoine hydroxylase-related dioxygenase (phytanoyl-CoA dioxygenase family)
MWRRKSAKQYIDEVKELGYTVLEGFLPVESVDKMADAFAPILETRLSRGNPDRGPSRFYATLPFTMPFADPAYFSDPFLLVILEGLVGIDPVMCQLAVDTPLEGSEYQTIHRDTEGLFFELPEYLETPAYQLALNFPLCDVPDDSWGPLQISKRTHLLPSYEQNALIESNSVDLDTLYMKKGDAIIRDVRGLHRGTPNTCGTPRPMVVVGYSRKWLRRPEVGLKIPQSVFDSLNPTAKRLLRFEPIVPDAVAASYDGQERYDAKALTDASGQSINLES